MAVTILLEVQARSGELDTIKAGLERILPDTRAFDGCQSLEVLQNQDDPNTLVIREVWDSRAQYEAYFQWRLDSGTMDDLVPLLEAPPSPRFFDVAGL